MPDRSYDGGGIYNGDQVEEMIRLLKKSPVGTTVGMRKKRKTGKAKAASVSILDKKVRATAVAKPVSKDRRFKITSASSERTLLWALRVIGNSDLADLWSSGKLSRLGVPIKPTLVEPCESVGLLNKTIVVKRK